MKTYKGREVISQTEVLDLLRTEGLDAGISSQGTISAFVNIPMYSIVASCQGNGLYNRNEVLRFISDHRMAKRGDHQYEGK